MTKTVPRSKSNQSKQRNLLSVKTTPSSQPRKPQRFGCIEFVVISLVLAAIMVGATCALLVPKFYGPDYVLYLQEPTNQP